MSNSKSSLVVLKSRKQIKKDFEIPTKAYKKKQTNVGKCFVKNIKKKDFEKYTLKFHPKNLKLKEIKKNFNKKTSIKYTLIKSKRKSQKTKTKKNIPFEDKL
jgi:hypothetical protein